MSKRVNKYLAKKLKNISKKFLAVLAAVSVLVNPALAIVPTPTVTALGGALTSTYTLGAEEAGPAAVVGEGGDIDYWNGSAIVHKALSLITETSVNGKYTLTADPSGTYDFPGGPYTTL